MFLLDFLIAIFISKFFTIIDRFYGLLCKFLNVHIFFLPLILLWSKLDIYIK